MAAVVVHLKEVEPLGKGWSFVSFKLMGDGFLNFDNMKLTVVLIDDWFILSNFQSLSDLLL